MAHFTRLDCQTRSVIQFNKPDLLKRNIQNGNAIICELKWNFFWKELKWRILTN